MNFKENYKIVIHDNLNNYFFNEEDKLKPEIRYALLRITKEYIKTLSLSDDTKIYDIILTGSIANYNYTENSDVDIHLVIDYNDVAENENLVKDYFIAKKNLWLDNKSIEIHGHIVEFYAEDKNNIQDHSGRYSLIKNKWVIKPNKQSLDVDKEVIKKKANEFIREIVNLTNKEDISNYDVILYEIEILKEKIRNLRSEGLDNKGELDEKNIVFKFLRNKGYLDKLSDFKNNILKQKLSLPENQKK